MCLFFPTDHKSKALWGLSFTIHYSKAATLPKSALASLVEVKALKPTAVFLLLDGSLVTYSTSTNLIIWSTCTNARKALEVVRFVRLYVKGIDGNGSSAKIPFRKECSSHTVIRWGVCGAVGLRFSWPVFDSSYSIVGP
jgi:hypothetical protein